jgi:predicted Zn-dependent protease
MNQGDAKLALNDVDGAMSEYAAAAKMMPNIVEIKYWAAITMITAGREKEAMPYFREVFAKDRNWIDVTKRLPAAGLLPDDPGMMEKILGAAPMKKR